MDFSEALTLMKQGRKVRRQPWLGRYGAMEIMQPALPDGKLADPLILIDASGIMRPFTGSSWDLLAEDWEEADGGDSL